MALDPDALTPAAIAVAVRALLASAELVPPGRVFGARATALEEAEIPALVVYAQTRADQRRGNNRRAVFTRTANIAVECVVKANDGDAIETALDELVEAVDVILTDDDLLACFEGIISTATDYAYEAEAGLRRGAARTVYTFQWQQSFTTRRVQDAVALDTVAAVAQPTPTGEGPTVDLLVEIPT